MKKILIVEDEQSLSHVLSEKIQKEGYAVKVASDGFKGLAALKEDNYDLILLDVLMPNMNGLAMLDEVRKSSGHPDIPVIIISNLQDPSLMTQALELNSLDYLVKSDWSLSDIVAKIKERLS
jgi:DNA-binding response OmpR family regulator